MKTANLNGISVSCKYNSDGLRNCKKRGSTQFHYRYDASGTLASIKRVKASGSSYTVYVICNSRGDIDELRNENGSLYARYVYDTWGNTIHILDANGAEITNNSSLAIQNPFRYRGYYYNIESGMYYLQSRYYDPVTGRFISADKYMSVGSGITGFNMYAYCLNNPVIYSDDFGDCPYNGTMADFVRLNQGLPSMDCNCQSNNDSSNANVISRSKQKPNMTPRKDKRHGSEKRQKTGAREKNVGHPNGEEHSRVPKGNGTTIKRIQYGLCAVAAVALIVVTVADDVSGVGFANDVMLPVYGKILWNSVSAFCF